MKETFLENVSFERTWNSVENCAVIGFDASMTIHTWNTGARLLFGYDASEIEGRHIATLNPVNHYSSDYMHALRSAGSLVEECWQKRRDGSLFWAKVISTVAYDKQGLIVGFAQIVQNISIVGIGLTLSSKDYSDTLDDILDYAVLLLDEQGVIQNVSRSAEKIKGYSRSQMIGQHVRIFYTPEDQSSQLPEKLMAQAAKEGRVHYEGWRVRKDGSRFWGVVVLTALTDWQEKVIGYYKLVKDLTERKQATEAKDRYLDHLEKHAKEIEELAYISSHDLKEPIRTIISFLDLFYEHYEPMADETGLTYVENIRQCANRMLELVNAILKYSLIGSKKEIAAIDLNSIINDIEKDLHESIQSTQTVIQKQQLPVIDGYPTEIRQLFQNLISNAIKFRRKDVPPVIVISASRQNSEWAFVVEDNGIGFNEKFGERIFQLFQRLHRIQDYEGTGIGLSYAKKIVQLHKGRIWARSVPGEGSRFYFTISAIIENDETNQRT